MDKRKIRILLADDDSTDRELFGEAIKTADASIIVEEAGTGLEVIEYLEKCNDCFPDMIFLDLNMPVMDGREALRLIKSSERLKVIPVFILSTSSASHDVNSSYQAGANLYTVKPDDFEELADMVTHIVTLFKKSVAIPEIGKADKKQNSIYPDL
jgi:CheY-like chemotaxis protein